MRRVLGKIFELSFGFAVLYVPAMVCCVLAVSVLAICEGPHGTITGMIVGVTSGVVVTVVISTRALAAEGLFAQREPEDA